MMNPEKIPIPIFDWIDTTGFLQLDDSQKRMVLEYMTQEDYEELFENNRLLKIVHDESNTILPLPNSLDHIWSSATKNNLKSAKPVYFMQILWRAAAVLLIFGAGWITNAYWMQPRQSIPLTQSIIDTLFVEKKIYLYTDKPVDTLFAINQIETQASSTNKRKVKQRQEQNEALPNDVFNELDNSINRQKRNSLKDDRMAGEFEISIL